MKYYIVCDGIYKFKHRLVKESKVYINRNTSVGESADFYEMKPHNGKMPIQIIGVLETDDNGRLVKIESGLKSFNFKEK